MHKFYLRSCRVQKGDENSYSGTVVSLLSKNVENLMLFFPISEDNASLINFVLENRKTININQDVVGIYKTMVDSWKASDKFVSGVVIDTRFSTEVAEDILDAAIIIIDSDGAVDAFVKTSFVHAVVVAAMEDIEITITDELFNKLYPKTEEDEEDEDGIKKNTDSKDEKDEEDDEDDNDEGGDNEKNNIPPSITPQNTINKKHPVDKDIVAIAKKIINGNLSEK